MVDGSSPPVRGTQVCVQPTSEIERFIPACAGNTRACGGAYRRASVHPRLCGEHQLSAVCRMLTTGSSPPVRGTHCGGVRLHRANRFIPACAGNTTQGRKMRGRLPVHPRLCGEHSKSSAGARMPDGSSPPVRGTHAARERDNVVERFIPACAGNTGQGTSMPA